MWCSALHYSVRAEKALQDVRSNPAFCGDQILLWYRSPIGRRLMTFKGSMAACVCGQHAGMQKCMRIWGNEVELSPPTPRGNRSQIRAVPAHLAASDKVRYFHWQLYPVSHCCESETSGESSGSSDLSVVSKVVPDCYSNHTASRACWAMCD